MGFKRELREELRDLEDRKDKPKKSKITGVFNDIHGKQSVPEYTGGRIRDRTEDEVKDWAPGEWCEVCHNGGDVLYGCDRCPRVYHPKCYVPLLKQEPPDDWICNMCTTKEEIRKLSANPKDGPNGSGQMGLREIQICRRILLELFNSYPECQTFQSVKELNFRSYRRIIDTPIALDLIRDKLDINSKNQYWCIRKFVDDVRKMFSNCRKFWKDNRGGGEYIKDANTLERKFNKLLQEWQQIVYLDSDFDENETGNLLISEKNNNGKKKESKKEKVVEEKEIEAPWTPPTSRKKPKPATPENQGIEKKKSAIYLQSPEEDKKYLKVLPVSAINNKEDIETVIEKEENDITLSDQRKQGNRKDDTSSFNESSSAEKSPDLRKENNKKESKKRKCKNDESLVDDIPADPWERIDREIEKEKKSKNKDDYSEETDEEGRTRKKKLHSPPKDGDLIQCKFCDAVYTSNKALKGHALKHFEDKISELLPDKKPFKCPDKPFCTEVFDDRSNLMKHYAFEHYMYLKDLSNTLGKPVSKSRYTVLMNKDNLSSDINSNSIAKGPLGLRSVNNVPEKKKEKFMFNNAGRRARSCAAEVKQYEDLSDESIEDIMKREGLSKAQVKEFYQSIEDSRSYQEDEDSREDTPDEDKEDQNYVQPDKISEDELNEEERDELSAFADLPLKGSEDESNVEDKELSAFADLPLKGSEDELNEEEKGEFAAFADLPLS